MKASQKGNRRKILAIDVGGTNVKLLATGQKEPTKFPSGRKMTAPVMVKQVKEVTKDWDYDAISLGYPGPIINGRPLREPHNLGGGWMNFDYSKAFGRPVKIVNDASMQALGSYEGGRMLFLGLGTGLGSAMIVDGALQPMELAHLLYRKGKTYEDYLGLRGLERLGKKKWRQHVAKVVALLKGSTRGGLCRHWRRQREETQKHSSWRPPRQQCQCLPRRVPPLERVVPRLFASPKKSRPKQC